MLALHGKGVSSGIAIGRAYVLKRERLKIPEYVIPAAFVEDEVQRFLEAVETTRRELSDIRDHIPPDAPVEAASFLDTHLLILNDTMVSDAPIKDIRDNQWNAEFALKTQSDRLIAVFEGMEDPYLRNKKIDVAQVVERVLRNLLNPDEREAEPIPDELDGRVVVANDLAPADAVTLKNKGIVAFITNLGGPISHTAILSRSLGIPAIVAVHGATRYIDNNDELIVDGKRGILFVAPDAIVISEYEKRARKIERLQRELKALRTSEAISRDGITVQLLANIELPEDMAGVHQALASGIGLYRTEFLFMNRKTPPDEEEQFAAYVKVIRELPGQPVTIRTLDLGADKHADIDLPTTAVNPALGLRAVRLCLQEVGLFKVQLRAILRASAFGAVRLMIPMLSNIDEIARVVEIVREVQEELLRTGVDFDTDIPIGGMIEVPAAAVSADLFAAHLDFLSIGTNDLIQYTLAIDRVDDTVNYLYDPLHPSVLRLIAMTIDAADKQGIPVAMCGEMAGDTRYTRLLLGLGLREFSMHPSALLEIKKIVRESAIADLKQRSAQVMAARDPRAIQLLVDRMNGDGDTGD
ncbi:phosphoenolpyruvate--protein phosphotransferase [Acidiferrobacter sp. SPIII_3]|jgi:phosphotransferase system enzyme I (PtsI)|uniref:phosphoenolpyruvate--protein phosphotransferase n=1 Tax=Acidiferrobacter sp. SPIII_3 TaxID=1281578 RepID=UPI00197A8486|nr:phosphoenolpyruvate--protein phosphotransferase [Acidiferrobacter sp. SPIII_3]